MIENINYNYEKSFDKQKLKLITKGILTSEQINKTIELYKENKTDSKLYYHTIICKKDKNRKSISVLGTGQDYKILLSEYRNVVNFIFIGHHKKYDRVNTNC